MKDEERGKRVIIATRAISFTSGVGGLERATSTQAIALTKLGWRVTVVAPTGPDEGIEGLDFVTVPWPLSYIRPGAPGFGLVYWLWSRRLRAALRLLLPSADALYVHGGAAGALRGLGAALRGRRVIANPHGMEEFAPGGFMRLTNRIFTRRLSRGAQIADAVVATDDSMVDKVVTNLRVLKSKVTVVPNAVDVDRLRDLGASGARGAKTADVVTVGRLVWNKGYDLLLEAIKLLLSERGSTPITWRHFGAGECRKRLMLAARDVPGLTFDLVSDAPDEEVQAGICAGRLFVQPSRYEGSSLTTLEAMAQGTVCVGTPVGGIPDKLHDGVTGFLASDVSAAALADAMRRAGAADSAVVGAAAEELVEERFSLSAATTVLESLLNPNVPVRRRVLQVARHIGPGSGVAQVVYSLEQSFSALGVDVERLTLSDTHIRMKTSISRNPLSKVLLGFEVIWFSVLGTLAVRQRAKRDPDVEIIVHGDPIGGDVYVNHGLLKAVMEERRGNRKLYVPANPMHWLTLLRDEYRYSHAGQSIVVNLNARDDATMHRLYPRLRTPTRVIHNGVNPDRYHDVDEEFRAHTRAQLGFVSSDRVLIFVGHEFDRKGLFIVLDALRELSCDIKLLVVGGTREMVDLARQVACKNDVERRTFFVGMQADPRPYYAAADVFVLPSAYEAAPLVLLEALACGKPCIVTSTGIAPEAICGGLNGRIVARDAEAVRAGVVEILKLLQSQPEAVKLNCQSSAGDFAWTSIAQQYLDLLAALGDRR